MKQDKKEKIQIANKIGRVIEGKKIGKKRYKYIEYIPQEDEIGKKVSNISSHDGLIKDRYDSIFRRGIMEPRNIKVHANKKKNIKVKEYVPE